MSPPGGVQVHPCIKASSNLSSRAGTAPFSIALLRWTPPFDYCGPLPRRPPGWEQGLQGMCEGEKRTLTIPHELAYGESGMGPIPAKATLVFDVEMVSIAGGDGSKDL